MSLLTIIIDSLSFVTQESTNVLKIVKKTFLNKCTIVLIKISYNVR